MQILHSIANPTNLEGIFWGYLVGRNGRHIGNAPGAQQWDTTLHLFRVPRGTPPEINTTSTYRRTWWSPFNVHQDTETTLTTVHGRLRSQSRGPRRYWAQTTTNLGWRQIICPECLPYADITNPNMNLQRYAAMNDPWTQMNDELRATTPDPISGM